MKFIGIDLGWRSGASGLCCLEGEDSLKILNLDCRESLESIWAWLETWVAPGEPALVAVDAPTLIPNDTGMRQSDRLTHHYFGRYHAGCYPANLSRPFAQRTVEFGLQLERYGFRHAPTIVARELGRYQIEVYPHPAIVHLFGLERILKYKKGKLSDRRGELNRLRAYITTVLPSLVPSLSLPVASPEAVILSDWEEGAIAGKALKSIEDRLDSLICAYVGAYWWYWGSAKNSVLGDATTGYIVVPKLVNRG